ncbi:MAG: dihydroorotase [Bacteroidales bacterium]|nr:dihydroorotase [Bacteroidales bacterium]
MSAYHIINALIINEGKSFLGEVFVNDKIITKINENKISNTPANFIRIDAKGNWLMPGIIDDQVHFRQPGNENKATIYSESRAAVAGGVTSFMDMPNTNPPTLTQELLENKYNIAAKDSLANYSFYMGVSNDNIDEVLKTPLNNVCGIKIFLGSSTGNLLVNNQNTIEKLFAETPHIIAAHCEDEKTIRKNTASAKNKFGNDPEPYVHSIIRDTEACFKSSSHAISLAKQKGCRLHVLHISTAKELELFDSNIPLEKKKITAEVCLNHLLFDYSFYKTKGNFIKCNPSVKSNDDMLALRNGLKTKHIDIVATDHAPHLSEEKNLSYFNAPSGCPMVQHSLQSMIELMKYNIWSKEDIVTFMCHNPAILFNISKRGFIREGYFADLALVDPMKKYTVNKSNILYKCNWSPLEGTEFSASIDKTFVNGDLVWDDDKIIESASAMRLTFDRKN